MTIDYSVLAIPKPRPRILEKREKKFALDAKDRAERKKCRIRSGGRCEIQILRFRSEHSDIITRRCRGRATQNHHLIGGNGRRNRDQSILAECRVDICARCHAEINAGLLRIVPVPVEGPASYRYAATVRYERVDL